MTAEILTIPFMDLDRLDEGVDLLAEIRALNSAGVRIPWAWSISAGQADPMAQDEKSLTVGVRNEVGALVWTDEDGDHVPVGGTNAEWLEYFLGGSHGTSIPPGAEVDVETVHAALGEFLRTRARPTCVRWRAAPGVETILTRRVE